MKEPEQIFTLLNSLNKEQLQEISFLAGDMQTSLPHIYKAIEELQQLCRHKHDEEIDKHINGEILADIKDILKKI